MVRIPTLVVPVLALGALAFAAPVSAQCESTCTSAKKGPSVAAADECSAGGVAAKKKDLVDTALGAPDFSTLVTAVKSAELVDALRGDGPFTIFAPKNSAFAALPEGTVASLLEPENRALLTEILTYHVVPGKLLAKDVVAATGATTLAGQRLEFRASDHGVTVDGVSIVKTDIVASNGVIHVIDGVLMPAQQNLVAVAKEAGAFETLIAAAKAAGLVPALTGDQPLTVLAPSDEAFAALPEGTLEHLLQPAQKEKLAAILKLHVIPGRVYSPDALAAERATALSGGTLDFALEKGGVTVNGATVTSADLDASNGVIHVIDRVLLP